MTDTRFPESVLMDRRFQRLTPPQFVSYFNSMVWTVSNRTNGLVEPEDLPLIPRFSAAAIGRFEELDLWEEASSRGWQIKDWKTWQTGRDELEVLDRARATEREKKRRQRAEQRISGVTKPKRPTASSPGTVPGTVPGTGPGDDTGQDSDRTVTEPGQDYTGGPVSWKRGSAA